MNSIGTNAQVEIDFGVGFKALKENHFAQADTK